MHIAEIKIGDSWHEISIDEALKLPEKPPLRCGACHGRVSKHRTYADGAAAHFAHTKGHIGCSRSLYHFKPPASQHPKPVF